MMGRTKQMKRSPRKSKAEIAYDKMFEICKIADRYRDGNYRNSESFLTQIKRVVQHG